MKLTRKVKVITGSPKDPSPVEWSEGAVLIMDALGSRKVWAREDLRDRVESWREIVKSAKDRASGVHTALSTLEDLTRTITLSNRTQVGYRGYFLQVLSDTLVIALQGLTPSLILPLSSIAQEAFLCGIAKGIFFRGVISCGEFFASEKDRIIVGPAVDEAAEWYERPDCRSDGVGAMGSNLDS